MNILVLGTGGREHALCWKIAQSPLAKTVYCASGNAGTAQVAQNVSLDILDAGAITVFAQENDIELVVIGPEAPLVSGISDQLRDAGLLVFGPSQAAAMLEASKAFTRTLCDEAKIVGARWQAFSDVQSAKDFVQKWGAPIVVKADGLAAGKGVTVAQTKSEALAALDEIHQFGDAGSTIVLEQCLVGKEASLFVLCDGTTAVPLALARDHKRIGEGDTGPNTGGMGCFTPIGDEDAVIAEAMSTIIQPSLDRLQERGTPFQGLLFAGLMLCDDGVKLIEYNVRFGDPECQAMMLRMAGDLLPLLMHSAKGTLAQAEKMRWHDGAVVNVVLAAEGYPNSYPKNLTLPDTPKDSDDLVFFHAGTKQDDGLRSNGGRVLNICAKGVDLSEARAKAYQAIDDYGWDQGYFRRDIGL